MVGWLLLAATGMVARAQEEEPRATDATEAPTAAAMLDDAIATYLAGEPARAREKLRGVLALGPDLEPGVRQRALAYLGDILYSEEGPGSARSVFETLLLEAPDFPMDPFEHPPEVCRYFEELRAALRPPDPPPVTRREREPFPGLVFIPGGTYYFSKGQVVRGALVGSLQVAGAAISASTLLSIQDAFATGRDERETDEVMDLVILNRASATVGWLAFAVPVVIETAAWDRRQKLSFSVSPSGVAVRGAF